MATCSRRPVLGSRICRTPCHTAPSHTVLPPVLLSSTPMKIETGTRLGPYEIVSPIGAGGMGEVWRARDTRLDRDVAIKVLPPGLAENELFLQRFEREAKAISQLNHAHVCTLYDVGAFADRRLRHAALSRHGAPRGRVARGSREEGPPSPSRRPEVRPPDRLGARRGAPSGDHASRSQAGQHHADEVGREAPRLRPRKDGDRGQGADRWPDEHADRGEAAHHRRNDPRDVPVHGARAARRTRSRRAHRHLRAGRRALRDGDGPTRVPGTVEDEPHRRDRLVAARADLHGCRR